MTGEAPAYEGFDPTDPEFVAWSAARDAERTYGESELLALNPTFYEDLERELDARWQEPQAERQADWNVLIDMAAASGDLEEADRLRAERDKRQEQWTKMRDFAKQHTARMAPIMEEELRVEEFMQYKQAKGYAAIHGITVREAMIELFPTPEERLLKEILEGDYSDVEDDEDDPQI